MIRINITPKTKRHRDGKTIPAMAPSMSRLKLRALATVIKTTIKHFTSSKYPKDWDLAFHLQFEVLKQLDIETLKWTIEDVWLHPLRLH